MKAGATLALALLLAAGAAQAGGVRLGIGVVVPVLPYGAVSIGIGHGHHGGWYRPWGVPWVVVPVAVVPPPHRPEAEPAPRSVGPTLPDPVISARHGQDANQAEFDRQRCNRWAVTQPAALADAAEFQRTVARCLDGLGYTMK